MYKLLSHSVVLLEVLLKSFDIRLHDIIRLLRCPAAWDNVTGLISILEGLDKAHALLEAAANGQVVDGDVADDAFVRDDEHGTQGDAGIRKKDTELFSQLAALISKEVAFAVADTTFFPVLHGPCKVRELRIAGTNQDFTVVLLQFSGSVAEVDDLRGTNESEVQRIEEDNEVLTFVVGQLFLSKSLLRSKDLNSEVRSRLCRDGDGHRYG